jgi:hypothetical protein
MSGTSESVKRMRNACGYVVGDKRKWLVAVVLLLVPACVERASDPDQAAQDSVGCHNGDPNSFDLVATFRSGVGSRAFEKAFNGTVQDQVGDAEFELRPGIRGIQPIKPNLYVEFFPEATSQECEAVYDALWGRSDIREVRWLTVEQGRNVH